MKRILLVFLIAGSLLSVVSGCGGPHRKDPVTLDLWHNYGGTMQETMDELLNTFNAIIPGGPREDLNISRGFSLPAGGMERSRSDSRRGTVRPSDCRDPSCRPTSGPLYRRLRSLGSTAEPWSYKTSPRNNRSRVRRTSGKERTASTERHRDARAIRRKTWNALAGGDSCFRALRQGPWRQRNRGYPLPVH